MSDVERYAYTIAGIAAGVAGMLYLLRLAGRGWLRAWRGGRRAVATVHQLGDELLGDPETGKLGMPERLDRIEAELHPNGGGSLRDAVNRTEVGLAALDGRMASVETRLAALESAKQPMTINVGQVPQTPSP